MSLVPILGRWGAWYDNKKGRVISTHGKSGCTVCLLEGPAKSEEKRFKLDQLSPHAPPLVAPMAGRESEPPAAQSVTDEQAAKRARLSAIMSAKDD